MERLSMISSQWNKSNSNRGRDGGVRAITAVPDDDVVVAVILLLLEFVDNTSISDMGNLLPLVA
jgi:hypothetical protein